MPNPFRCVIKVRVLAFNIRERVMPYHMLMIPHVGSVKHKANVHSHLVNGWAFSECEVASIVEDVYCEDPKSKGEGEQCIPVSSHEEIELGHGDGEED